MRSLFGVAFRLFLILLVCVFALLFPYFRVPHVKDSIEASKMLEDELRAGGDRLRFRTKDIDLDEVYAALESRYPYAFSIHASSTLGGITEMRVDISRPARQKQAWGYAKILADECVTKDMDDSEKFRALHDMLVRLCEYDTEAAADLSPDGATAPFAADGALMDHKAVCAGYGRAFVMLCDVAGLDAVYISSENMNHGWNAVRLCGITYFIDCTFDDPVPDQGEYVYDKYFMLTSEELEKTHSWDEAFYEMVLDSITN